MYYFTKLLQNLKFPIDITASQHINASSKARLGM